MGPAHRSDTRHRSVNPGHVIRIRCEPIQCRAIASITGTALVWSGNIVTIWTLYPLLGRPGPRSTEEADMTERSGNCLCGAVRYRISGEPVLTRVCWCRDCQHLAANGTVNLLVPTNALEISGALSTFTSTADSGNQISRRFCPRCGSHLFANSSARPQFTVVRAGTLSDPSSVRPTTNIWASSAPTWACLDSTLERVAQQPSPPPGPGSAPPRP